MKISCIAVLASLLALSAIAVEGDARRAFGPIQPRISPDGSSITFSFQGAIWRIPRDGSEAKRLTTAAGFDSDPAWSPDGKRIAYSTSNGNEMRLIDAETGAPIALPQKVPVRGKIYFHPDGKRVLANFGPSGLAWTDLATGTAKAVLEPPKFPQWYCLSPNGEEVAYVTSLDVGGEQTGNNGPETDIWIAPVTGGTPRKLTRFRSHIFDLWWTNTGLYISSDLGGAHNHLWNIHFESPLHGHRLTNGLADEDFPSVSNDGRWLVYTDNRERATALVLRDLSNGDEKTLTVSKFNYGTPLGLVKVQLTEKGTGAPLTARVSLQLKDGKYFAPPGALYRSEAVEHFYAAKEAEVSVPVGHYTLQAFRGIEYRSAKLEFDVAENQTANIKVELERWTNPQASGWWGGESHIHANYGYGYWYNTPETIQLQVEGEGINAANLVVANSDSDGIFDREFFRGEPDPHSSAQHITYWNQEFRATLWGHLTLYNLKHLSEPIMTGFLHTTNPYDVPTNSDVADHVHLQGGLMNYTHPVSDAKNPLNGAYAAKALPVDVALGKIDSLDINWGGGWVPTVSVWQRFMNCGFHLSASAGTDCFLNRIRARVPGGDRAYVKLDGPFSFDAWVKGLKAGRTFVTNGPMVSEFTAGGKFLGETITLAQPGEVPVKAAATWTGPFDRAEIIVNGEKVADATLSADKMSATFDKNVKIEKSGWLNFCAFSGNRQVQTGAIYVEVAGKPAASKKDAEFFLEWIDRLEAEYKPRNRVPSDELKAHVDGQFKAAREVFKKIAAQGE